MPVLTSKIIYLSLALQRSNDFLFFMARRLYRDHCAQIAASLTYTSLLAFVPFLIVGFAILREFPLFPELVSQVQTTILQVFTPDAGEGVKQYIQGIVNKGTKLPVISFFALLITAVMMLYTIDDTLNRIWRVEHKRRTWISFVIYLLVVISGPLLLGSSLAITTYIVSQSWGGEAIGLNWLASVPWLVTFMAFTSLYRWVPNSHVDWKYALSGGLVAMLLFELAKWGFALYIRWVPTYSLLYGTLAAIPLTLVWIYLSWLVVLMGAETARCLAVYSYEFKQSDMTARQILGFFFVGQQDGLSLEQAATWGYLSKREIKRILHTMQQVGLVQELAGQRYILTARAEAMSLIELNSELTKQLKLIEK